MKKHLLLFTLALATFAATAQTKIYTRKGYTLNYSNTDATLDTALQTRMVNTFFEVYPKLAAFYNPNTEKVVYMKLDTTYKGVAATGDAHIRISPKWMHDHPED